MSPFRQGLNQDRSDQGSLNLPFLRKAENLVFEKFGELKVSNPLRPLKNYDGKNLKHIFALNNRLGLISDDTLYTLNDLELFPPLKKETDYYSFNVSRKNVINKDESILSVSSVPAPFGNLDYAYVDEDNKLFFKKFGEPEVLIATLTNQTPIYLVKFDDQYYIFFIEEVEVNNLTEF